MIYVFGAGGHAKVIIEILEESNITIAGLLDDNAELTAFLGYKVSHQFSSVLNAKEHLLIIAVGNNSIRKQISERSACSYATAVHKNSSVSRRSTIGEGTVMMAGTTVNSGTIIKKHVILNTNSSIDHDCVISDYVHVSPNVAIAGGVFIGEGAHIGIGASVIQGIRIGQWAVIGAGAVILNDVPDFAVVVGNPGKIIKFNEHEPI
ncbi:MAG: epsM [Sphingobacteriaceae bacterium]|jgi:acetyltransferase EpsM|nr:epsM [Sphingobacteriaceae bacterium]